MSPQIMVTGGSVRDSKAALELAKTNGKSVFPDVLLHFTSRETMCF